MFVRPNKKCCGSGNPTSPKNNTSKIYAFHPRSLLCVFTCTRSYFRHKMADNEYVVWLFINACNLRRQSDQRLYYVLKENQTFQELCEEIVCGSGRMRTELAMTTSVSAQPESWTAVNDNERMYRQAVSTVIEKFNCRYIRLHCHESDTPDARLPTLMTAHLNRRLTYWCKIEKQSLH